MVSLADKVLGRSGIAIPELLCQTGAALYKNPLARLYTTAIFTSTGVALYGIRALNDKYRSAFLHSVEKTASIAHVLFLIAATVTTYMQLAHVVINHCGVEQIQQLSSASFGMRLLFGLGNFIALGCLFFLSSKLVSSFNVQGKQKTDDFLHLPEGVHIHNTKPQQDSAQQVWTLGNSLLLIFAAALTPHQETRAHLLIQGGTGLVNVWQLAKREWTQITSQDLPITPLIFRCSYMSNQTVYKIRFAVYQRHMTGSPTPLELEENCSVCLDPLKDAGNVTEFCPRGHFLHRACAVETIASSFTSVTMRTVEMEDRSTANIETIDWSILGTSGRDYILNATEVKENHRVSILYDLYIKQSNLTRCPTCRDQEAYRSEIGAKLEVNTEWKPARLHILSDEEFETKRVT